MAFESTLERINAFNGLGCLVKALVGRRLIIDLRNEATLTGIFREVDGYMSISLEDAVLENCDGVRYYYDNIYVKGRHIRYIHIPKELINHILGLAKEIDTVYIFMREERARRFYEQYNCNHIKESESKYTCENYRTGKWRATSYSSSDSYPNNELTVRETIINFLKKSGTVRSSEPKTALHRLQSRKLRQSQEETKRRVAEQKLEKKKGS